MITVMVMVMMVMMVMMEMMVMMVLMMMAVIMMMTMKMMMLNLCTRRVENILGTEALFVIPIFPAKVGKMDHHHHHQIHHHHHDIHISHLQRQKATSRLCFFGTLR